MKDCQICFNAEPTAYWRGKPVCQGCFRSEHQTSQLQIKGIMRKERQRKNEQKHL